MNRSTKGDDVRTILAGLLLFLPVLAHAVAMPIGNAAAVNTEVTTVFSALDAVQAQWLVDTPGTRYLQVRPVSCALNDGVTKRAIDSTGVVPPDRAATSTKIGTVWVGATRYASYHIDEYKGPLGQGFIVTACITTGGVAYWRSHHVGPEALNVLDGVGDWVIQVVGP